MKTYYLVLTSIFFLIISTQLSLGQHIERNKAYLQVKKETKNTLLQHTSSVFKERIQNSKESALKYVQQNSLPISIINDSTHLELIGLDPIGKPLYYTTYNRNAAQSIGTEKVWNGGTLGLSLSGSGLYLGIWDGGGVRLTHDELQGRVFQKDYASSFDSHSTHVAGTLIATGVLDSAKGMAYEAGLHVYNWNYDVSEMAEAAADGMLISNHSYGFVTGWSRVGGSWIWYGDPDISKKEDWGFGFYSTEARDWDQIAYQAPYYLIFKAAGNNRGEGPSNSIYPQDGPYDCIGYIGNAKNIITVGSVEDINSGYSSPEDVKISSFSSWGPTDDGRIKPDIVTNGSAVLSTSSSADNAYESMSGTSMATPSAAGSSLLLQELYQKKYGSFMLSSTLKALIIHTTDEAGDAEGPDYTHGWGLMNTAKAAQVISESDTKHQIIQEPLANNTEFSLPVTIGNNPVTLTLVWTDVAGNPVSPSLDPKDLMLVNDLDMRLIGNGKEYLPYILDPSNPSMPATRGDNFRDNVEKIYIAAPTPGIYNIKINHKGNLVTKDQTFSLITSGVEVSNSILCSNATEVNIGLNTVSSNSRWFVFNPMSEVDGVLKLSTIGLTDSDTRVQIYSDCTGGIIDWGDNEEGLQTEVQTFIPANESVYIKWENISGIEDFNWLLSYEAVEPSSMIDSMALVKLYETTNGSNWVKNDNWLTDAPLKDWWGIETNEQGRVTKIDLFVMPEGNNLTGELPIYVKYLTALEYLSFKGSNLTGGLTNEYINWNKLNYLDLSQNKFSGIFPEWILNLTNLDTLILEKNEFTGSIPSSIDKLEKLKKLDISNNKFTGFFSTLEKLINLQDLDASFNEIKYFNPKIGNLANLKILNFSYNNFNSSLPREIGNLTKLEILDISSNQFSGYLPSELGNLTNLLVLNIYNNQFTYLPSEFGDLTNLQTLNASNNKLIGNLPSKLGKLHNLQNLDLSVNDFKGNLPPEWSNLKNLQVLDISGNELVGNFPPLLHNLTKLQKLDVSSNKFDGELPIELGSLVNLQSLDVSSNKFTGNLPTQFGYLSKLQTLDISDNDFTGNLPLELGNLLKLQSIDAKNNQLEGNIPEEFGALTSLKNFMLKNNNLSGNIPESLQSLSSLTFLELENNGFTSLPDLSNMDNLFLKAQNNYFTFKDILPNLSLTNFEFIPQKKLNLPDTLLVNIGDTILLSVDIDKGIENNQYSWYFDYSKISTNNSDSLQHIIKSKADLGVYSLKVTNSDLKYVGDFDLSASTYVDLIPELGEVCDYAQSIDDSIYIVPFTPYWYEFTAPEDGTLIITSEKHKTLDKYNSIRIYKNCNKKVLTTADYINDNSDSIRIVLNLKSGETVYPAWYNTYSSALFEWELKFVSLSNINSQRDALEVLYFSLDGANWQNNQNWLSNKPLNEWYGINTNKDGYVTNISLGANNLSGKIPDIFRHLPLLQELVLHSPKNLSGDIPSSIYQLTNLQTLDCTSCGLEGELPIDFVNMPNLEFLYLDNNNFTGTLHQEFGNALKLKHLYIGNNNISGKIPWELSQLNTLTELGLNNNILEGPLPASFGNLTNLKVLNINDNFLDGKIDSSFNQLNNLEALDISNNYFTDLPNLSSIATLSNPENLGLKVKGNSFTFEDILPNISISNYEYSPQKKITIIDSVDIQQGESYTLTFDIDNNTNANVYTWYKNNYQLAVTDTNALEITKYSKAKNLAGTYDCKITNPNVSGLRLYTTSVIVSLLTGTPQTISFDSISNKVYDDTPFKLLATASSGLPVTFAVLNGHEFVDLKNNTVSIKSIGEVTIGAYQAGNDVYSRTKVLQTFKINKAKASINITETEQNYDGSPKQVYVTTFPESLKTSITYDDDSIPPTDIGEYKIQVNVVDDNYEGTAADTLIVSPSNVYFNIDSLEQIYDGNEKRVKISTVPSGLNYTVTYNGKEELPLNAGEYEVKIIIKEINYEGKADTLMKISKAIASLSLIDLSKVYDGSEKRIRVDTEPAGLNVDITYNGDKHTPINAGKYFVLANISEQNYQGVISDTLHIAKEKASISISNLEQVVDQNNPRHVTVTTIPSELETEVLYDGNLELPMLIGEYKVVAKITDKNYTGDTSAIFRITEPLNISKELSNKLLVYPNPSNGKFVIEITTSIESNALIQIFSIKGLMIYEHKILNKKDYIFEIDLSDYPSGSYLLQYKENESIGIKRLIKQ
ncbi:MBG domain-containing protein [Chondrinema litorale]|uniref:MBG domain-containing protein n=1 Tax=Chondrinema litorale TaxID=2994555 RepID=UPI00254324B2|nr:MBG domain-containing protein [Chondrinema litorale]UZR96797.1 MBG domain-containing protein [Chondrinema litorale]